jgi:hypothetical protein
MYMADLVLAALMAGLLTSAFTLRAGTYSPVLILALIFIVANVWSHIRNMRDAPTCDRTAGKPGGTTCRGPGASILGGADDYNP